MITKDLNESDLNSVREIHEKFYKEEFDFPDFYNHFICRFVSIDNDNIIAAGGIRTISEAVLITNKDATIKQRHRALLDILNICGFCSRSNDYDQIHAFVKNDDPWENRLLKEGFKYCAGKAMYLNIE